MTTQRVSQLAGMITGPTLGLPVITASTPSRATFGVASTYQFTATSDLSVTWTLVSGTLPSNVSFDSSGLLTFAANATPGDFSIIVGAVNARGTQPVTVNCSIAYQAALDNVAVTGFKVGLTLPADTVSTIQWYKNTGAGPVAVGGATTLGWTPTGSEVGAYLSARGRTVGNVAFFTPEYTATHQVMTSTGPVIFSSSDPSLTVTSGGKTFALSSGITLAMPTLVRSIGSGGYYVDQILAAGTYTANDPILIAGLTGAPSNTLLASIVCQQRTIAGPPAVIQKQTDSASATATRPSGNTGTGFFVRNGALYDPNGNKFRIRGINQCHNDSGAETQGLPKTKYNLNRMGTYLTRGWLTDPSGFPNKTLIDNCTASKTVSMPAPQYVQSQWVGTISGNILTVTSMTQGLVCPVIQPQAPLSAGDIANYHVSGTGVTTFTVSPFGTGGTTGTGKTGTYLISVSQTVSTPTAMGHGIFASGSGDGYLVDATIEIWVNQAANWTTYNDRLIIDLLNEWGPSPNAFTVAVTGTTMTVSGAANAFILRYGMSIDITGFGTVRVTGFGTGAGGNGTYTIDTSLTVTAGTAARDSTWREAWIRGIARLRTAGYTCPFAINMGGSGQDSTLFTNGDALAILNADTQHNVLFSLHQYGLHNTAGGGFAAILAPIYTAQQASLAGSAGLTFIVGEFGPGYMVGPSPSLMSPIEIMGTAEAYNFGWIPWAWDDPASGTGNSYADLGFAMCQNAAVWAGGGYSASNPADLTDYGRQIVLNPTYGTSVLAVPATIY